MRPARASLLDRIPAQALGYRRGETDYAIGGVLFGGCVKMLGDESGPPDIQSVQAYQGEISGDLIQAAERAGLTGGVTPEERLPVLARRLGGAPGRAEALAGSRYIPVNPA